MPRTRAIDSVAALTDPPSTGPYRRQSGALGWSGEGSYIAPEAYDLIERDPAATLQQVQSAAAELRGVQAPQDNYWAVMTKKAHQEIEPMMLMCQRSPQVREAMLEEVNERGWVEYLKTQPLGRLTAYEIAADLAMLLRNKRISQMEYWTGSMMLGLWGDSQGDKQDLEAVKDPQRYAAHYVSGHVDWQACVTYDASRYELPSNAMRNYVKAHLAVRADLKGSERFCYGIVMHPDRPVPGFPYAQFKGNSWIDFIKVDDRPAVLLASGTILQTMETQFGQFGVKMQPRVGVDSVKGLQELIIAGGRPLGLAVQTPRRKLEPTTADGQVTGLAGFAAHDVEHGHVICAIPQPAREKCVELHRFLAPLAPKVVKEPVTLTDKIIPKLVRSNLFGLTDLSTPAPELSAPEFVAYAVIRHLGQDLGHLIIEEGAATRDNVGRNLLDNLQSGVLYSAYHEISDDLRLRQADRAAEGLAFEGMPVDYVLDDIEDAYNKHAQTLLQKAFEWLRREYPDQHTYWTPNLFNILKQRTGGTVYHGYWQGLIDQCTKYLQGGVENPIPVGRVISLVQGPVLPLDRSNPYMMRTASRRYCAHVYVQGSHTVIYGTDAESSWYKGPGSNLNAR